MSDEDAAFVCVLCGCLAFTQAERTNEELLAYLPPMKVATTQVSAMTLLGSVYHTK